MVVPCFLTAFKKRGPQSSLHSKLITAVLQTPTYILEATLEFAILDAVIFRFPYEFKKGCVFTTHFPVSVQRRHGIFRTQNFFFQRTRMITCVVQCTKIIFT